MKKTGMGMAMVLAIIGLGFGVIQAEDLTDMQDNPMGHSAMDSNAMPMEQGKPCCSPSEPMKCRKPMPCKDSQWKKGHYKSKELELNWNAAIGSALYSENDEDYSLTSMGINLEINPGIRLRTVPGLEFGTVIGFTILSSEGSFEVAYDGPPETMRNWDVAAVSAGSYILAEYGYTFEIGRVELELENGFGLGYFVNSVSADWVDADDSDITGSESDDESGWMPVLKAGFKAAFKVTQVSSLGLNLGANLMPMTAGDYQCAANFTVGLNYEVAF